MHTVDPDRCEKPHSHVLRRRELLATAGTTALGFGSAGCLGLDIGNEGNPPEDDDNNPDTSPGGRALESTAVEWSDLGDLEGELVLYVGRTRDQIDGLFAELEERYADLTIHRDYNDNASQLNKLREEGTASPADVFYTQSSSALAAFKSDGLALELPTDVLEAIATNYRDPDGTWTGVSGRVRAIQYHADEWVGDDLPENIYDYAVDERFSGEISTRPNSGSFHAFVLAMIEMEGEAPTREWVRDMVETQDITLYASGSQQAQAVHNGEQSIALGNQYYAGRIIGSHPDTPLRVTFTRNDPGCLFNVSGLAITRTANDPKLASEFVRHVLAAEGQEFFVDANGEYPVVDGVEYVGDLPNLDEIEPPEIDLNALADVERAVDILREEGMRV